MTNLQRLTGKIFGETATATGDDPQIGQFGSALAGTYVGTTDVTTIQSLPAWSNGFIDSVTPNEQFPPLPEMTGFGKVLSYQTAYTLQKGVPEWDPGTTYYTGDFCKGIGEGKLYISKIDSNINNDLTDTNSWEEFSSGASRNIGEIVTSTIPLTDAGLHLLDGALIQYGSYQAFIDYMADLYNNSLKASNVDVIGSLTDNNGVLSGFSTSNYVKIPYTVPLANANSFEFVTKFTYNTSSNIQDIYNEDNVAYFSQVSILTSGKLYCLLSNNHSSSNIGAVTGSTTLTSGNTYYIKFAFTGSAYKVYLSSTGAFNGEESEEISITSSAKLLSYGWNIGCSALSGYEQPFNQGTIDLNESYININGSRWWSGRQPKRFTDEAQWQAAVSTYGVCGKFVYDSVANTVRLPKYSGKIYTKSLASTVPVKGNGIALGLTNGTTNYGLGNTDIAGSSALALTPNTGAYGATIGVKSTGGGTTTESTLGVTTDSTKSGIIADLANITTALDVYYYIVIATSTKTNIQVDIDEIATDLNGKADVDLSNVSNTAGFRKLVELYNNGTSWYKVFREYNPQDGSYIGQWCEQGSYSARGTISLLKNFRDTNYSVLATITNQTGNMGTGTDTGVYVNNKTTSDFYANIAFQYGGNSYITWEAKGYIN